MSDELGLSVDAGQFFTVSLLPEAKPCSEEDCEQETRIGVRANDGGNSYELRHYCKDHVHVLFADWMVGA